MKNKTVQNMLKNREGMAGNRGNIRMKKARILAMALCIACALGQAGTAVYAQASGGSVQVRETAGAGAETVPAMEIGKLVTGQDGPINILLATNTDTDSKAEATGQGEDKAARGSGAKEHRPAGTEELQTSKEETVYILADADGSVQKIIVSDWIKNALGLDEIHDITDLKDLETVKDELEYTAGTDNETVWNAGGKDIYYQGNTEKDLPVTMDITYMLDGKEITPRELAGKSGKVTIRFDYTNTQYEDVTIDGGKTRIYVPFAMMTGMILDDEVFTNVEVTNGRLVNDGDRTVVVGLAFPGLQETLDVDRDKMEIPDYMEITADVKDFELGMTATVASNSVFSGIELERDDAVEELNGSMGELKDAMDQLMDGSGQLYDGLCTLLDKSAELIAGIDKLAAGSAELRSGAASLDEGAAKLQDGAAQLQNGLNTLASKNGELNGGARQVFETLLSTARTQLTAAGLDVPEMTVENYEEVLNQVIASLDEDAVYRQALTQVTNAVEEKRPYIESQVTDAVRGEVAVKVEAAVREQVTQKVTEAAGEQVSAAVTEAVRQQVTAKVTEAAEEQVRAAVTQAVRTAVTEQVEAAGKAEITNQVTAAVKAEVTKQVTEAVRAEVTKQVTEAVKTEATAQVTAQVREQLSKAVTEETGKKVSGEVIQKVTGMDQAAYEAAVEAGTINEQTKSEVDRAVAEQMESEEVKNRINTEVDNRMESEAVKGQISTSVDNQMESDTVKDQIRTNVDTQMESEAVKGQIHTNVDAQMAGNTVREQIDANVKSVIEEKVEEQMATDDVKAQIEANTAAQMEAVVPAKVEEQMAGDEIKAAIQANIDQQMQSVVPAKVEEQMASEEIKAAVQSNIDAQMNSAALKDTVAANTKLQVQKAITENMAGEEVQSKLAAASEGAKSVIALKSSIDSYNVFYLGLQAYTAGVAEAASGAGTLTAGIGELRGGTSKLYDGSNQLYDGIQTMKKSTPALTEGITKLRDGALELSDGLDQFNEEGIGKLVDAVDGDLQGLIDRLRAMADVSKNYKSFAGIAEEMDGSVKFIYRTDAIEADTRK